MSDFSRFTFTDEAGFASALSESPHLLVIPGAETDPATLRTSIQRVLAGRTRFTCWVTNDAGAVPDGASLIEPLEILEEDAFDELGTPLAASMTSVVVDADALNEFGGAGHRMELIRLARQAEVCVRIAPRS